ncbi:RING-H2 finger protein ATL18 [Brachypodium distachyon]|nr:RING-H2 finger protein ATL18 [Brachypodium distachyon]|eukprot:XP_010238976.1 RING-H2 finger protein ATL18 [Brachypodium distachyon]
MAAEVFCLGFVTIFMLCMLKSLCSDCIGCFRRPASAPTPARTAAAGPRPAVPAVETQAAVRRPCSCVNPPPVVRAGGDPSAARRLGATGPVPCVTEYQRSDGWREAMCPVCLCDFADGEVVRVLPPCMHYFHAACVGEWLRKGHTTCPLCRAAPPSAATATAASSGSPEYVIYVDQLG